jgi:adenylate kinase family enzyme
MKLILMRGVSGSGKSTLAQKLAENHESVILSTDDYFMVEGKYLFEPRMIGVNHARNQERARHHMSIGTPCVIIDNTNTQAWEMRPYVETAMELGYEIEIHEPDQVSIEEIMRRQESRPDKNLPLETVQRMLDRFEKNVTIETILKSKRP